MNERKKMIILLRLIVYPLLIYVFLRIFEWKNIYYPTRELAETPDAVGLGYEDVTFNAVDGCRLHGWWIPRKDALGAVIVCHGNAGNIGDRVDTVNDLYNMGCSVFIFDYRGYGQSSGCAGERGTYRDVMAAYDQVHEKYGRQDNPPIVLYGRSLGGAVAVQGALERPVRGLIMESTFPSIPEMAAALYPRVPLKYLCAYRYDSFKKVKQINVPLLMAHSRDDQVIPFELSRKLFEAANEPKQFVELTHEHNWAGWHTSPEYKKAVIAFLKQVLTGPSCCSDL